MSFQAVEAARLLKGLKPTDKFLLMVMGSYADPKGQLFPSQKTLAEDVGISPRSVWSRLKVLEAKGYLTRSRQHDDRGNRTSDLTTLNFLVAEVAIREKPTRKKRLPTRKKEPVLLATHVAKEPSVNSHIETAREAPAGEEPASRAEVAAWMNDFVAKRRKRA